MRNSAADRWFGVLLRCYPHTFRARFEPGMRDALHCEHAQARADGTAAIVAFWFWTFADAVRFGFTARRLRTKAASIFRSASATTRAAGG